jgi:hypothetical protein
MFPSLCASINAVVDGAHLHSSSRSLMVQAALLQKDWKTYPFQIGIPVCCMIFSPLSVVSIALTFCFCFACTKEKWCGRSSFNFIAYAERNTPRSPGVFYPPSSAEPSPPSSPPSRQGKIERSESACSSTMSMCSLATLMSAVAPAANENIEMNTAFSLWLHFVKL